MTDISKQDMKLFRQRLPEWQEAWMERLCKEYIELLSADGLASDRFWELDKRIREDKKHKGVIVRSSRMGSALYDIVDLVRDGAITMEDLTDFSEELQEQVRILTRVFS